jgi:hypothetical protein
MGRMRWSVLAAAVAVAGCTSPPPAARNDVMRTIVEARRPRWLTEPSWPANEWEWTVNIATQVLGPQYALAVEGREYAHRPMTNILNATVEMTTDQALRFAGLATGCEWIDVDMRARTLCVSWTGARAPHRCVRWRLGDSIVVGAGDESAPRCWSFGCPESVALEVSSSRCFQAVACGPTNATTLIKHALSQIMGPGWWIISRRAGLAAERMTGGAYLTADTKVLSALNIVTYLALCELQVDCRRKRVVVVWPDYILDGQIGGTGYRVTWTVDGGLICVDIPSCRWPEMWESALGPSVDSSRPVTPDELFNPALAK